MRQWLPGGGRVRSGRFRTAQGAGRGNDPRFHDRWRLASVLFGEESEDIPTLLQEIDDSPGDYPDGTPVYVDDDGGGSAGWVIVYDGTPVPTTFDDVTSYGSWLDSYPVPDGVTVWVDDDGSGSGGLVTSIDGEPIPTGPGSLDTTCSGSTGVLYHIGAAAADTDIDTADLVTASDTSDLP